MSETGQVSEGRRIWRKQVLPNGEVSYCGRKIIDFTPPYLGHLVQAFAEGAFGVVPFQVAGEDGRHTNDPACCRGEVIGLEVVSDGLDALIAVTGEGDRLLREEPDLGGAPRIVEDYCRSDGHEFPAAMQHVLGTRKPLIHGLRPWHRESA